MAINTAASSTNHTGNGSTNAFAISFSFLANSEIDVTVAGVLKTLGTHYTISGSTVTFTSGNTPANGAAIKFQRDTDISAKKVDFSDGSVLTEADLDANSDQILFAQQEIIDKLGGIEEGATADQTASEIKTLIASSPLDASHLAANSVDSSELVDGSVDTSHLSADCVTSAKIADNSINSEHYVDGSIDHVHLANDIIDSDNIQDNAINSEHYVDGSIDHVHLSNDCVDGDNIADDSINSEHYVDGSIDTQHIANGQITSAKMAFETIETDDIAADAITNAKIADDSINSEHYVDGSIDTQHIADDAITTAKIANDALTGSNMAAGTITTTKIADDAITTGKIADAELKTLAGMQSGTASKLADSTALTSDIADLNQLDGMAKQTTITDDDTKFPTSGAVVDFVAAQLAPIGGLEVIATDAAFPNTQPAAGVVISIADAGGLVVDANGTSTTARTVGGTQVTINNFASNFNSSTVDAGVAIMVSSTGAGQVYNYHKATLKEADLLSLSNDINDFAARYRVTTGEPTSNNDEGDLIYDTQADKMKVFDSTTNAFKEVTSVGDFKFLFLCPTGGSGSPTIDGSIATYDLREGSTSGAAASITSAAQLIVSINGVIQKPNTGTSAPSEGFAMVDSNTIIFGSNLPTGAEVFVIQIGSAIALQVPADNTVATAKIQNQGVTTAKIADDAVTQAKIAANAVDTTELAVGAVTHDQLADNTVDADHLQSNAVTSAKIVDDAVTSAKIADDAVGADQLASNAVVTASIVDNAITPAKINVPIINRNLIINGAMQVSQRGTSFSQVANNDYTLDRFMLIHPYSTNFNVSQSTTSPDGFSKSYKLHINVVDSSIGSGQYVAIRQRIEAQDLQQLAFGTSAAKPITLSFYVRSNKTGTFAINIQQTDNSSKQVSAPYTINSADTWERKTFTFAGDTSGVINDDTGTGLTILWWLSAGSTFNSGTSRSTFTAHADADAAVGCNVNILDSTSNNFYLTGVQLEVGSVATDFEHKSFDEVRRQCYRYFQKVRGGIGVAGSSSQVNGVLFYRPMRTDPSVSKHGTSSYQFGDMVDQGRSTSNSPSFFRNDGLFGHSSYMLAGFSGMTTGETMRDEGAGGDAAFELSAEL